jgi:Spx/MgsR family transcriptional regulator
MTLTVYGIRQCDSCRQALKWLDGQGIEHRFHDLRADGLERERVARWLRSGFAAALVNRRSTTWRQLTEPQRGATGEALLQLLLDHPTLIKRPVFENARDIVAVGFNPAELSAGLAAGGSRARG